MVVIPMMMVDMVNIPVATPNRVVMTVIWQMTLWIRMTIQFIPMSRMRKMMVPKQMCLHGYQFRDQPRSGDTDVTMTSWDQFWDVSDRDDDDDQMSTFLSS